MYRHPCPASCEYGGGPTFETIRGDECSAQWCSAGSGPGCGKLEQGGGCAHGRRWVIAVDGVVHSLTNSGFKGAWIWYWRGSVVAQYVHGASNSEFSPWLSHVIWLTRLGQLLIGLLFFEFLKQYDNLACTLAHGKLSY